MLSRLNRLTSSAEIGRVVKQGQALHAPLLTLFWQASALTQPTRIACVAGKKVSSSAVVRHRVQRQLRVAARQILTRLPGPYDIVLLARPIITREVATDKIVAEAVGLSQLINQDGNHKKP